MQSYLRIILCVITFVRMSFLEGSEQQIINAKAHYHLGKINYKGKGYKPNDRQALFHFDQAVRQCASLRIQAAALFFLGKIYFFGRGVVKSEKNAKDCLLLISHHEKDIFQAAEFLLNRAAYREKGYTDLHVAVICDEKQECELLLNNWSASEKRGELEKKSEGGWNALHWAVIGGSEDITSLLIAHGSPIDAPSDTGLTPLHCALENGNHKTAVLLLQNKASLKAKALNGFTPIHFAARCGDITLINELISNRAQIAIVSNEGRTPLHCAVESGNQEAVQRFLELNANINAATWRGFTPLHFAAEGGDAAIVKILLVRFANTRSVTKSGKTALHCAAQSGTSEVIELLLEYGADANAQDNNGETPLHYACLRGDAEIVKLLLAKGGKVGVASSVGLTELHFAAISGNTQIGSLVLDPAYNKSILGPEVNLLSKSHRTPLHMATMNGRKDFVAFLLAKSAETGIATRAGETALLCACRQKQEEIALMLIDAGAPENHADENGYTALHWAAQNNLAKAASLLLRSKIINAKAALYRNGCTPAHLAAQYGNNTILDYLLIFDKSALEWRDNYQKETPLHYAASSGNNAGVKLLISHGANVDARNKNNVSVLEYAASKCSIETIELLLDSGASINTESKDKYRYRPKALTPFEAAISSKHKAIVELFLTRGVDVKTRNNYGETCLFACARFGTREIAEYLIANGADPKVVSKKGQTPLHAAAETRNLELVDFLLSSGIDVNVIDVDGHSCVYPVAASYFPKSEKTKVITIIEKLMAAGVPLRMRKKEGEKPYEAVLDPELDKLIIKLGTKRMHRLMAEKRNKK